MSRYLTVSEFKKLGPIITSFNASCHETDNGFYINLTSTDDDIIISTHRGKRGPKYYKSNNSVHSDLVRMGFSVYLTYVLLPDSGLEDLDDDS